MSSLYNPTIEAIEAWLLGYTEVSLKSTFFKVYSEALWIIQQF